MVAARKKTQSHEAGHEKKSASLSGSRIEKYYSKIVAGFVIVALLLVALIVYFSFSKTTITVHPQAVETPVTLETNLQELDGVIVLTDVEGSRQDTDLSSGETRPGRASGVVTIENHSSRNQGLVETTRLLSESGVLFRTQETVTVPAGGTVDVRVAADQEGEDGNVVPGKWEIVALSASAKEQIYGVSKDTMAGGVITVAVVSQEDIDLAKADLRQELLDKARGIFASEISNYEGMPDNAHLLDAAIATNVLTDEVSAVAGDEIDNLTVTQKLTVAAPVVNTERLTAFVQEHVNSAMPQGAQLVSTINLEDITITVGDLNDDFTNANLSLEFSVATTIDESSPLLDPSLLTNKTDAEIRSYLGGFKEIASVEVDFSPFWVTQTPALKENITVRVD